MADTSSNSLLTTFTGQCHCGKIVFQFEHAPLEQSQVTRCNCSICVNRGYLFVYPQIENLRFVEGSLEDMTAYFFAKKRIGHYFCPVCGSGVVEKRVDGVQYGVNLRCVRDVDFTNLTYRE